MAHSSPYLRNGFEKKIPSFLTMILIFLLIQLTSGCVFTYKERRNQLTEQCKMEAVRDYLNTVVRITGLTGETFQVRAEDCTVKIQPFIGDSRPLIQFEACKADEDAPTATLCLSKHIDNEWRLHAICKVC